MTQNPTYINQVRLKYIIKGFMTIKDIERFCECGYPKAKAIYNEIARQTKGDGKRTSTLGIRTTRLLNYLDMTEEEIRNYVSDELRLNMSA